MIRTEWITHQKIRKECTKYIKEIYPNYYTMEVVDFFSKFHSKEAIQKDIEAGKVGILIVDGVPVGTGCYQENHITRVYVEPEHQGKGYGSYIMKEIEAAIQIVNNEVYLDASLPACHMSENRYSIWTDVCQEYFNLLFLGKYVLGNSNNCCYYDLL